MRKRLIAWMAVAGGISLSLAVTAGAYHISKKPLDEFLPHLSVMGEFADDVSSIDELLSHTQTGIDAFLNTPVEWTAETGSLIASPAELGLELQLTDLEEELERLDDSGFAKLMLYFKDKDLRIEAQQDEELLQLAFSDSGIEQGMKNASYFYEGKVKIDPDQTGHGIEYDQLKEQLSMQWESQFLDENQALPMRINEPDFTTELLEENLESASLLADSILTLQDNDGTEWNLWLADHIEWILPGEEAFIINDTSFYTFIRDELAEDIEEDAQSVVITETEKGYEFEGSARAGRSIDYEASLLAVEAMINKEEMSPVVLVVNEVTPEITLPESLALLGVTDLLGYGYSNFTGSPTNRVYNVNHGMDLFNGTLLAPGEEFSFTTLMGEIDAEHGWYPELVIKGDETIPEYGGGLCQVSSTMFRTALLTGMPITSRRNHSYAVSYYAYPDGYGLDATVYDPWPDFRFINDTSAHILIQGYTNGTEAYFVFYGTDDGRSVTMEKGDSYGYYKIEEPEIEYTDDLEPGVRVLEEYAHTGFKIDWWRTITYADGTISESELFHSDYEARPAKYSEGTPLEERESSGETEELSEE